MPVLEELTIWVGAVPVRWVGCQLPIAVLSDASTKIVRAAKVATVMSVASLLMLTTAVESTEPKPANRRTGPAHRPVTSPRAARTIGVPGFECSADPVDSRL